MPSAIQTSCKQVIFSARDQVEVVDRPLAEPGPGQVLVRNRFTLISPGTELAVLTGTHQGFGNIAWVKFPFHPGYAAVGMVESCGPGVVALRPGDRIMHAGVHADRGLADLAETLWAVVPDGVDDSAAPFARLTQISATAATLLHIRARTALVLGGGLVGNLAAQVLAARGVSVVLQEPDAGRRRIALACGLRQVIGTDADPNQILGGPPDCVIEATGVPALVGAALDRVARLGEVMLLGSPRGLVEIQAYHQIHRQGVLLSGANEGLLPTDAADGPCRRDLLQTALADMAAGTVVVEPLCSGVVRSDELSGVYLDLQNPAAGRLGVLIDWTRV
jgi:2-desacetyl-2-hydroxyethyl bacteriochlorophyllide A dehydrogenase